MVDWPESWGETPEVQNVQQNVDYEWLLLRASTSYVDNSLDENLNYFNLETLDNTKIYKDFWTFVIKDQVFGSLEQEMSTYNWEKKNEIASKIKQLVIQKTARFSINRNILEATFLKDYKITSAKHKTSLSKKIKELAREEDINNLLKSELERLSFLQKNNIEFEDLNENDELIKNIWLNVDSSKLTDAQSSALKAFYVNHSSLTSEQYVAFLSIFSVADQKKILEYFIRDVSLSDLISKQIITQTEAEGYLKAEIQKAYKNIPKVDVDKAISTWVDFSWVRISTKDLSQSHMSKLLNSSVALESFFHEMNEAREKVIQELDKDYVDNIEYDEDSDWNIKLHENFLGFIKQEVSKWRLDENIENSIANFQQWWYIKFKKGWKTMYYYVEEVDSWSTHWGKSILLKNLYSYEGDWKVRTKETAPSEVYTYKQFYRTLKNLSDDEEGSIDFLSGNDFSDLWLDETNAENNIQTAAELVRKIFSINDKQDTSLEWRDLTNLTFLDAKQDPKAFFWFESINDVTGELTLEGNWQSMSYSSFFESFVWWGYIFQEAIKDASTAFATGEAWSVWMHESSDILVAASKTKEKVDKKNDSITHYVKWNVGIRINNISEWIVDYTFWTIQKKWETEKIFNESYHCKNWNQFLYDISSNNLEAEMSPKLEDGEKQTSSWWGIWKFFANASTLAQLWMAWKMLLNWVEEYVERWDKLKASRLAQSMWKLIPVESVRSKIDYLREEETKKRIQELVDELKRKKDYSGYIKKYILDKPSASDWEVYAGMQCMVEKTGGLNTKALNWEQWKFKWYKKLWWAKGDELYKKMEDEAAQADSDDPTSFTEEKLIESLLWDKDRFKKGLFDRAWKEFWNALNKGISEESEDGTNKTAGSNNIHGKVSYFLDVLGNNELANTTGSLIQLLWKNSWPFNMWKAPFIFVASNVWKDLNPTLLGKITKKAFEWSYAYLQLAVRKDTNELFNDSIVTFLKEEVSAEAGKEYAWIMGMSLRERVKKLNDFWELHWNQIQKFLNMEDGNMVLGMKRNKQPYLDLYNKLSGVYNNGWYSVDEDELNEGVTADSAFPTVWDKHVKAIELDSQWSWFRTPKARKIADAYFLRLENIRDNSSLNREEKKELFDHIYKNLWNRMAEVVSTSITRPWFDDGYVMKQLTSRNLILKIRENKELWDEEFLQKAFDTFMDGSWSTGNSAIEQQSDRNSSLIRDTLEWIDNDVPDMSWENVANDEEWYD